VEEGELRWTMYFTSAHLVWQWYLPHLLCGTAFASFPTRHLIFFSSFEGVGQQQRTWHPGLEKNECSGAFYVPCLW